MAIIERTLSSFCLDDWLLERGVKASSVDARLDEESLAQAAIELASLLVERAVHLQTPQERRQQAELDRMLQHPEDKATLTQMTDQGFRSNSPERAVDQMVHILDVQGIPRFFGSIDWMLLKGFQSFGGYLPGVAVPLVKEKMREETANVILPAEPEMLKVHLQARRVEGVRMNVNFLGEALLGEKEARRRLESYLAALQMDEIECVSVKISTLYSQISTVARKQTLNILADRLELLYRAAAKEAYIRHDGTTVPKFVYLDMEEYRDMRLTSEVFRATLDRKGLSQINAGIALQAYIPDSFLVQQEITDWATRRVAAGGAPVTIRIVKGANMEMERVEAALRGWPQAPYLTKLETDANFKRMLRFGLQRSNHKSVRLGIASHNLFDIAYALVLVTANQAIDDVQFEMLEGMANHQRRALFELSKNVLLYAPACTREEFINAIGYLIRRLDENTGPDNFLRHAFKIVPGGDTWNRLADGFRDSVRLIDRVPDQPRRTQNRIQQPIQPRSPASWQEFENEPDTDFSLPHHADWAQCIVDRWKPLCDQSASDISIAIDGTLISGNGKLNELHDPSRPGVIVARYHSPTADQLRMAVECAADDKGRWRSRSPQERFHILMNVAHELRVARADLMGAAMSDGGKTLLESDPEVSEAIDFVTFYARSALDLYDREELKVKPKGVVLVLSPWNFPIAIPCGGVAAALAAGNTVLLKPASDTVLSAYLLCQCFWRAGVPLEALQFVPCSGVLAQQHLVGRPEIDVVILTGGTETALRLLGQYPSMDLMAETGGKNATIVSSLSDRDQAIKNVMHSAFSHAGQKCSATSLLLLEEEVFEDAGFREQLIDAATSIRVGAAWDLSTRMGPLIRPPDGALLRGIKELERGETWAVMPTNIQDNPCLFTPGIKWNVQPGSFTHCTELFGPVLGVMKYRRLSDAIEIVNGTGYGLTSGLESLDDREQEIWRARIRAGNLYINRSTTGAIVLRQPFGGMGKSSFGLGIKAGGPNYVVPLLDFAVSIGPVAENEESDLAFQRPPTKDAGNVGGTIEDGDFLPTLPLLRSLVKNLQVPKLRQRLLGLDGVDQASVTRLIRTLSDYDASARSEFRVEHDRFRLMGQDNIRRYLPVHHVRVRMHPSDNSLDIIAIAAAAVAMGSRVTVSHTSDVHEDTVSVLENLTHDWAGAIEFVEESDDGLCEAIRSGQVDRLRYNGAESITLAIRQAAIHAHIPIADRPVCPFGCVELLSYIEEQSISFDYHRYGNIGIKDRVSI